MKRISGVLSLVEQSKGERKCILLTLDKLYFRFKSLGSPVLLLAMAEEEEESGSPLRLRPVNGTELLETLE